MYHISVLVKPLIAASMRCSRTHCRIQDIRAKYAWRAFSNPARIEQRGPCDLALLQAAPFNTVLTNVAYISIEGEEIAEKFVRNASSTFAGERLNSLRHSCVRDLGGE